jgi:hypothetical protein
MRVQQQATSVSKERVSGAASNVVVMASFHNLLGFDRRSDGETAKCFQADAVKTFLDHAPLRHVDLDEQ